MIPFLPYIISKFKQYVEYTGFFIKNQYINSFRLKFHFLEILYVHTCVRKNHWLPKWKNDHACKVC